MSVAIGCWLLAIGYWLLVFSLFGVIKLEDLLLRTTRLVLFLRAKSDE